MQQKTHFCIFMYFYKILYSIFLLYEKNCFWRSSSPQGFLTEVFLLAFHGLFHIIAQEVPKNSMLAKR